MDYQWEGTNGKDTLINAAVDPNGILVLSSVHYPSVLLVAFRSPHLAIRGVGFILSSVFQLSVQGSRVIAKSMQTLEVYLFMIQWAPVCKFVGALNFCITRSVCVLLRFPSFLPNCRLASPLGLQ